MKKTRKVIEIDESLCNGCGQCIPSCQEGALRIINGKAKLVADKYCDGLGACLGECPTGALMIVEREAEPFDEVATAARLASAAIPPVTGGCLGASVGSFAPAESRSGPLSASHEAYVESELSHWPVQIRLVPPAADFLRGADLLVAADCVPVAHPRFHQEFLSGRQVLIGCPKFDDLRLYEQRFTDIFAINDVKSVTVVVMEVPCCQGLPFAVQRAMKAAGKSVPMETVTVSPRGDVIDRCTA